MALVGLLLIVLCIQSTSASKSSTLVQLERVRVAERLLAAWTSECLVGFRHSAFTGYNLNLNLGLI